MSNDTPFGLDILLSEQELQCLQDAGAKLPDGVDRAVILRALMTEPESRGLLALVYKFGILRAMLLHRENKKTANEKEEEKRKEEEEKRLREEFALYRQLGPQAYAKANPLPIGLLEIGRVESVAEIVTVRSATERLMQKRQRQEENKNISNPKGD